MRFKPFNTSAVSLGGGFKWFEVVLQVIASGFGMSTSCGFGYAGLRLSDCHFRSIVESRISTEADHQTAAGEKKKIKLDEI